MVKKAKALSKLGATEREVAEFFDVSESTLKLWKHEHPKFSAALTVGKGSADRRVEQSLYKRATGYSFDAVKIFQFEGGPVVVPYVEHVPPDSTAMIFWLKNRRPNLWRDRKDHELSNPPGRPLEIVPAVPADPDLARALLARLEQAAAGERPAAGAVSRVGRPRREGDESDGGEGPRED